MVVDRRSSLATGRVEVKFRYIGKPIWDRDSLKSLGL